jgi:hypothetical protein
MPYEPSPYSDNEAFYRRFALPEELKNRDSVSNEWRGSYRWFASPNVVKLEDYRLAEEMIRALERLRCWKRDETQTAVGHILEEARRRRRK